MRGNLMWTIFVFLIIAPIVISSTCTLLETFRDVEYENKKKLWDGLGVRERYLLIKQQVYARRFNKNMKFDV